jgi:phage terminase small subunit
VLLAFQNCSAERQKSKIDREQLDTKLRQKIPEPPVKALIDALSVWKSVTLLHHLKTLENVDAFPVGFFCIHRGESMRDFHKFVDNNMSDA